MKNVYRFFKNSQPSPTVKRFSSGSGMLKLSEYTNPDTAKSFSDTDGQSEDLSSKVSELTAKVDQLTELVTKLTNQTSETKPEVKTGSAEESKPAEETISKSNQPDDGDAAATGNEETNEEAKGAEVPGNTGTGTYTQVPEDEIVAQFSARTSGRSSIAIPSLGNKDTFNVLFK